MKVSIITAYYKGRQYLDNYIKMIMRNVSNLNESDVLEVIIVNDSPDDKLSPADIKEISGKLLSSKCTFTVSKEELKIRYKDREVVIKVLTNEQNVGIHASRVKGLNEAKGEYVIFLDQDDLLGKDAVKTYIQNAKSKEEVLVSNAILQRRDTYLKWYRSEYHTERIGDIECYVDVGIQIISPGHCFIYKEAIPKEWKEYICTNNGADDYFLWLLMLAKSVDFRYIDRCLYLHSFTEKNLSEDTTVTDESTREFAGYLGQIDYFPDEYVGRLLRMVDYKAMFRAGSYADKLMSSLGNFDILMTNMGYKVMTRTPLGFNR